MNVLIALILAAIPVAVLESLRWRTWQARWSTRELVHRRSRNLATARVAAAIVAAMAIAVWWGLPYAAITLGSVMWLGLLAVETDLLCKRIPREPCWTALGLGAVGGVLSGSVAGAASFVVAFLLVGFILMFLALVTRGGLGSGDVRFMLAMTPLACWIGGVPILGALFIACLIQIVLRLGAIIVRRGAKYMAFAPALFAGVVAAVILWPPQAGGACLEWMGLLPC